MNRKVFRSKKPILVMGYDWERFDRYLDKNLENSLKYSVGLNIATKIHVKYEAPFTVFVLGSSFDSELPKRYFRNLIETIPNLIDLEIHGYSHVPFKKHPRKDVFLTLEEVNREIFSTIKLAKSVTKKKCIGVRVPQGHFRGLQGNSELLAVLNRNGIVFCSSDLRGVGEKFPAPWEDEELGVRQPYWYDLEGYPNILEIPTQGWNDNALYGMSDDKSVAKDSPSEVLNDYLVWFQYAIERNLAFAPLFHPWVLLESDTGGCVVDGLLGHAKRSGIEIMSYSQLYYFVKENER